MSEILNKHYRQLKSIAMHFDEKVQSVRIPEAALLKPGEEQKVWIFGAGKAAAELVFQLEHHYGDRVKDGIVITGMNPDPRILRIQQFKGTHPYPDNKTLGASLEFRALLKKVPPADLVFLCITGGASSLFEIPSKGIEMEELAQTYRLLLNAGAGINEVNLVRRHLSEVKGGKIARLLMNHELVTIALSDVPDNSPENIGSGPTVPDPTTFLDVFKLIKKLKLWDEIPHSVRILVAKGMQGEIEDTVKPEDFKPKKHFLFVLNHAKSNAESISLNLKKQGYNTWILPQAYSGDIKDVAKSICTRTIEVLNGESDIKKPAALLFYGESSVNVKGNGKGGRNQQLALMCALSLEGQHSVSILSLATDGIDGPTDAAGGIVNSMTTLQARRKELIPEVFLKNNDAYHFLNEMDQLLIIGSTGNNLMDLQIVLIE